MRRGARTLLLLLLATPGHRLPRDRVLDVLWPESTPEAALTALYTSLSTLRRVLEPGLGSGRASAYVEARAGAVWLRVHDGLWVDVEVFRSAMSRARAEAATAPEGRAASADALREAVAVYGGELLADEPYADWPIAMRESLHREWRWAVLELTEVERTAERPLAVVPAVEQLLSTDPWDEAAHRALIAAFAAAGRPTEAAQQYERCRTLLRDELGTDPEPETTALAEAIRSQAASVAGTPKRLLLSPMPTPPTPLIGRALDVATVGERLQRSDVRLMTVLGPGGMGKTRLAIEVARSIRDRFRDGVAWVPLASLRDPGLVVAAIARALGIDDRAGPPVAEQLRDALYKREILIVLDNLEHLMAAAIDIATILEGSAGTRILATSRAPLQIRAEQQYALAPLPLPPDAPISAADAGRHESVALFVDRVHSVDTAFALTNANAGTVAAICARLDGLPLAIELAAARCRHLSPEALLRQLDRRMTVLVGGARDLPDRLRTMQAAIEWSHDLLAPPEQAAFRRLAPFVGGASAEAAAAVVAAPGLSDIGDPAAIVAALADHSLVRYEPGDPARITMLETIRDYAGEQLLASGEADAVARAHAAFFLHWIEAVTGRLHGPDLAALLDSVEREHGNLRAAWATLVELDDPDPILRLAGAMGAFWRLRGHTSEGRRRLRLALARSGGPALVRARALVRAADLAHPQGDAEPAEAMYREALATFESAGDPAGVGEACQGLAALEIGRTSFDAAASWAERALESFESLGQARGMAYAFNSLATVAFWRGRLDHASELWRRCVGLLAEAGDDRARGIALSNLGVVALELGDHARALTHHRDALAIARRIGGPAAVTHPLLNLGRVLVLAGDHHEAGVALLEALENARLLGDVAAESAALQSLSQSALALGDLPAAAGHLAQGIDLVRRSQSGILTAATLEAVASVVRRGGASVDAARLLGAAEAAWAAIGGSREAADQPVWDEDMQAIRSSLDPEALDAAWAAGRSLTSETALDEAKALLADVRLQDR